MWQGLVENAISRSRTKKGLRAMFACGCESAMVDLIYIFKE